MQPEQVRELKMHPLAGVEQIEQLLAEADSVAVLTDGTLTLPLPAIAWDAALRLRKTSQD